MKPWLLVAGLYLAITLLMARSFVDFGELSSASFANDGRLIVWTIAWATHAIRSSASLFAATIYFPAPDALAYTEHMLGLGVLALPLSFVTSNAVLVFSLLWLAAFWSNAMAAHLLAFRLTGRHTAAVAAGLVFGWTFFRSAHLAHLQLQWTAWLPLSLVLMEGWFRQPTWRRLLVATAVILLQMLTSWYMAVMAAALVTGWLAWLTIVVGAAPLGRRLGQLAVAAAVGAVVLIPLAAPYVHALVPEPAEYAPGLSADVASYLAPPEDTWVGQLLERQGVDARWIWGEQTVFLGWMATLLAALGAATTIRGIVTARGDARVNHLLAAFFIVLTIAAVWLSFGPTVGRFSPFTLLTALPGVSLFRAPARFALLAILGVAILSAIGLGGLLSRFDERRARPAQLVMVTMVAAIMLVEWRVVTPIVRAERLPVPAIYASLDGLPEGAVMSLPDYSTGPEFYFAADYLLFATEHWRPIVNGFGRAAPPEHPAIVKRLVTFPSPDSAALARRLGVRYFIVHTERLRTRESVDAAQQSTDFILRAAVGPDYLFEVVP